MTQHQCILVPKWKVGFVMPSNVILDTFLMVWRDYTSAVKMANDERFQPPSDVPMVKMDAVNIAKCILLAENMYDLAVDDDMTTYGIAFFLKATGTDFLIVSLSRAEKEFPDYTFLDYGDE